MHLYPMSLKKAEVGNELNQPHVIVSINFPKIFGERANPATNEHTKEVLFLYFSDVGRCGNPMPPPEEILASNGRCVPFDGEMAQQVIDLINRHKVEHVIIHCLMGTSRSASMANALSTYYNGKLYWDLETEYGIKAINEHVYYTMLEKLNEQDTD